MPAPSGAVRAEVNLPRNAGQVEIGPEQSPGMRMGLRRGLREGVASSRMNRGGGREKNSGWEGGTRGSPHPTLRGE